MEDHPAIPAVTEPTAEKLTVPPGPAEKLVIPPSQQIQESTPTPRNQIPELKGQMKSSDRWMIWLTAAIAFSALCSIGVGLLQWNSMKGQLIEMQKGSKDTHILVEAANTQANAAMSAAETAKTAAANNLSEMQKQNASLSEQANISRRAANTAEEALHLTEAADIELNELRCSTAPQPLGLTTEILVTFKNYGHTRAEHVEEQTNFDDANASAPPFSPGLPSVIDVAAGDTFTGSPIVISKSVPTEQVLNSINGGAIRVRLWGWVTYKDVFGKPHRTDFNTIYLPKSACTFNAVPAIQKGEVAP